MRFVIVTVLCALAMCLGTLAARDVGRSGAASNATADYESAAKQGSPEQRAPEQSVRGPSSIEANRDKAVSLGLDISDLNFVAESVSATVPPQLVLVYFDNYAGNLVGDVYLQVKLSGDAFVKSSNTAIKLTIDDAGNVTTDSNQAVSTLRDANGPRLFGTTIRIQPKAPASLGGGRFSGLATVRACLGDRTCATGQLAGSPRTISISYQIGPQIVVAGLAEEALAGEQDDTGAQGGAETLVAGESRGE